MPDYSVKIRKKLRKNTKDKSKTEIWAEIKNMHTGITMNKLIWWKDNNGIYHDGTVDLPADLREIVDNAWIERCRKW